MIAASLHKTSPVANLLEQILSKSISSTTRTDELNLDSPYETQEKSLSNPPAVCWNRSISALSLSLLFEQSITPQI